MKKKELYKLLCLEYDLYEDILKTSIISNKCYVCKKLIHEKDFVEVPTYWSAIIAPKHKDCSIKKDVIECQKIDADCNDCKYFKRAENISKWIAKGECAKYKKEVKAYPNFYSGHECFVHRLEEDL